MSLSSWGFSARWKLITYPASIFSRVPGGRLDALTVFLTSFLACLQCLLRVGSGTQATQHQMDSSILKPTNGSGQIAAEWLSASLPFSNCKTTSMEGL